MYSLCTFITNLRCYATMLLIYLFDDLLEHILTNLWKAFYRNVVLRSYRVCGLKGRRN